MKSRGNESLAGGAGSELLAERDRETTGATGRTDGWVRPGDESLLESLRRDGPESCPLLAARIGMHLKYARRRCDELDARGLVRLSGGRFYELTERGERFLDGESADGDSAGGDTAPDR